jgi:hypothetical protein
VIWRKENMRWLSALNICARCLGSMLVEGIADPSG